MEQQGTVDDKTVPSEAILLRRVILDKLNITYDHNYGRLRPSSLAFEDPEMSAFIEAETQVERVMESHEGFCLVRFPAQLARSWGMIIVRKEIEIPGHVHVLRGKASRSVYGKIAKGSDWVISPPNSFKVD